MVTPKDMSKEQFLAKLIKDDTQACEILID